MSAYRPTVLVIDDDKDICDTFTHLLGESGYQTLSANSGNDALLLMAEKPIDIIISDILMPNGNGLKVRDNALERGIPVIFSTGFPGPYQNFISEDAIVMQKPYSFDELLSTLSKTLLVTLCA